MIKKIESIINLGVFNNFIWDNEVKKDNGTVAEFKKINVLYGRNWSGKTSLSRIFKSLEDREISDKIKSAEFRIVLDDKQQITNNDVSQCPIEVRVFSSDFVGEYLQWLNDESSGEIQSFAIMGEKNIEIEKKIKELRDHLGNVEEKSGLEFERSIIIESSKNASEQKNAYAANLKTQLRNKAREIKENQIFKDVNYDITKITQDIESLEHSPKSPLSEQEVGALNIFLKDEVKPALKDFKIELQDIKELADSANVLLNKKVSPSRPIQQLISDALLQEWVRNGIDLHKSKLEKCAFCGGVINDELWRKLDAHFSQESELLRKELNQLLDEVKENIETCDFNIPVSITDFYALYSEKASQVINNLANSKTKHDRLLSIIKDILEVKLKNIFAPIDPIDTSELISSLNDSIKSLNKLLQKNNAEGLNLSSTQMEKRETLRLEVVRKFLDDTNYDQSINELNKLKDNDEEQLKRLASIDGKIEVILQEISQLTSELRDERKGADKVNEYLSSYFGHESLSLEAVKGVDSDDYKFIIKRGEKQAYNLSEGEKSLISFCYFMAKLEDLDTMGKEVVVWIDDPVSSLDNNHIYFVFSLIENLIVKQMKTDGSKFSQLFVSTHNLEFLRYLKTMALKKKHAHFIVKRTYARSSIKMMPRHLREYVTEFNYLFHQIYLCAYEEGSCDNPEKYYSFGNNLRKFLEAYLFFKYPCKNDNEFGLRERILKFFDDDLLSQIVIFRIGNELSHLEKDIERSMEPIDASEFQKAAYLVLKKIKEKDIDQYKALIRSINGQDIVTS
ncbi:MAG: AAA family ATPase [Candidatus Cloacimonetes bacterium]|nr:AAA family ATPase [Candidatus Cloacimonadota bacterium]